MVLIQKFYKVLILFSHELEPNETPEFTTMTCNNFTIQKCGCDRPSDNHLKVRKVNDLKVANRRTILIDVGMKIELPGKAYALNTCLETV